MGMGGDSAAIAMASLEAQGLAVVPLSLSDGYAPGCSVKSGGLFKPFTSGKNAKRVQIEIHSFALRY